MTSPQQFTKVRQVSHILSFWKPWVYSSLTSRRHLSTTCPRAHHEEFYRNTSRRWIFNEVDRLNERFVKFRPTALQHIAGEAIQQDYCPDILKLAEGGFNKVFLLRAKNGREVIARIPTPIAGPPHYTTGSEVATMDFLRSVLKLPVPEVLSYSTISEKSCRSGVHPNGAGGGGESCLTVVKPHDQRGIGSHDAGCRDGERSI
ncbi:hypothetical protein BJY04DRAFT_176750 [Aspergillus karnatakaensis]|uniref:uncharacterized protein n=1 Tax=Aspergillus karnatakaensis TaxID=1810916 RepID=UPI003CCC8F35